MRLAGEARILDAMKRFFIVGIMLLALFGLSDSLYLAQHENSAAPLLCSVENLSDCNIVVTSQYARIFGIPLAEFGVVFYALLFIIAALELVLFDRFLRRIVQSVSFIGIGASLYFTAIELFVLKAWCIYCLVSAGITLLIFVLACLIEPLRKNPPGEVLAGPRV